MAVTAKCEFNKIRPSGIEINDLSAARLLNRSSPLIGQTSFRTLAGCYPRAWLEVGQPFQAVVLTGWKAGPT